MIKDVFILKEILYTQKYKKHQVLTGKKTWNRKKTSVSLTVETER